MYRCFGAGRILLERGGVEAREWRGKALVQRSVQSGQSGRPQGPVCKGDLVFRFGAVVDGVTSYLAWFCVQVGSWKSCVEVGYPKFVG